MDAEFKLPKTFAHSPMCADEKKWLFLFRKDPHKVISIQKTCAIKAAAMTSGPGGALFFGHLFAKNANNKQTTTSKQQQQQQQQKQTNKQTNNNDNDNDNNNNNHNNNNNNNTGAQNRGDSDLKSQSPPGQRWMLFVLGNQFFRRRINGENKYRFPCEKGSSFISR